MKGMIVSLWLIVGTAMFFSCDSDDQAVVVDIDINLTIEDADGNDLLNAEIGNFIQSGAIHVFYEINGKRETYQSVNQGTALDLPEGFYIIPSDGVRKAQLTIFSNPTVGDQVVTVIEIDGRDDVRLVTKVTRKKGNTRVEKIWYKDNLVWPTEDAGPKYVKIVY
jgi:hypothetical protein